MVGLLAVLLFGLKGHHVLQPLFLSLCCAGSSLCAFVANLRWDAAGKPRGERSFALPDSFSYEFTAFMPMLSLLHFPLYGASVLAWMGTIAKSAVQEPRLSHNIFSSIPKISISLSLVGRRKLNSLCSYLEMVHHHSLYWVALAVASCGGAVGPHLRWCSALPGK